jgi:hypothetical protein
VKICIYTYSREETSGTDRIGHAQLHKFWLFCFYNKVYHPRDTWVFEAGGDFMQKYFVVQELNRNFAT